jgi:hypothetical protein
LSLAAGEFGQRQAKALFRLLQSGPANEAGHGHRDTLDQLGDLVGLPLSGERQVLLL